MDWNTLPLWVRFVICYLAGFPLLVFLFAMEYAIDWLAAQSKHNDNPFT
jgi:hypothetical protein